MEMNYEFLSLTECLVEWDVRFLWGFEVEESQ